jgi:type IV pilus assembly protein PilY1
VVWRVDLPGFDPDSNTDPWTITPVLSVGRHAVDANGDAEPDRRFFHRPDAVPTTDDIGDFDGIMIGTGNRPDPQQNSFNDRFFMMKDRNTATGTPPTSIVTAVLLEDVTTTTATQLSGDCEDPDSPVPAACTSLANLQQYGWYIDLVIGQDRTPPISGEKMLSTSLTYKGVIFFTTYLPNSGVQLSCGPSEGEAYTYVINMDDGSSYFPTFTENQNRATKTGRGIASDPITIVLDGKIFITPGNLPPMEPFRDEFDTQRLHRTFWYEQSE